jgi:hypothetical protein
MRYRLRTLHLLLGVGPPVLAGLWYTGPANVIIGLIVVWAILLWLLAIAGVASWISL